METPNCRYADIRITASPGGSRWTRPSSPHCGITWSGAGRCARRRQRGAFISAYGTRLLGHHAEAEFRRITALTGTGASAVNPPRIHDLRHTFAVRTLAGWYRNGGDVAARMPLLSAYLGHVSPVSTYWYLHAVPELLTLAAQRLENTEAMS